MRIANEKNYVRGTYYCYKSWEESGRRERRERKRGLGKKEKSKMLRFLEWQKGRVRK